MAATDGQIIIAAARWSTEDAVSLRDFHTSSGESPKCELVKFTRGQFANLGVPNLPNPSLHSHAILISLGKTLKVAAQSVKFKDGKRSCSVSSGTRFSIPESYPGYFEILSEEGKAVKCIESVLELMKKFPDCVLVRENVRGFVTTVPLLELSADKSRTINAGEILTLQKDVSLTRSSRSHRFLQCTDSRGDIVYLSMEQRGKFSPLARNDNISGVHTLLQLVNNKRLPLMVRLVWGPAPVKSGATQSISICSELRLISTYEEESLFALPLGQHGKEQPNTVVALPMSCNLKFVRARNHAEQTEHFQRLAATASRLARELNSRMTVLETFKDSISFWNISPNHSKHIGAKVSNKNFFMRRSVSHENQILVSPISQDPEPTETVAPTQDFLEIDQIYDYVRGFAPLPKSIRSNSFEDEQPASTAPQPPPIETIPSNKQQSSDRKIKKIERQKVMIPSSKTALKMELHAQNLAQESLRSSERAARHEGKRLFKSRTTSSLVTPSGGEQLGNEISSSTRLLTQADICPTPQECLEPMYENTTQVYLECDGDVSTKKSSTSNSQKKKATSEIAHRLRETSPISYYKKNHETSKQANVKKKILNGSGKTSKSHEDLIIKQQKNAQSSPTQPSSPSTAESTKQSSHASSRRRRLSKQRSLSSLLAGGEAGTSTVIEHRPVELHLQLSRPTSASRRSSKPSKLGILYL
ncbi:hypothetical protein B566_EDAN009107 [Ephemera danica]|nr:hypothetical protein B566_EDAN009107 [Ephemera danica]